MAAGASGAMLALWRLAGPLPWRLALCPEFKVLQPVVGAVTVSMVDVFVVEERAAKGLKMVNLPRLGSCARAGAEQPAVRSVQKGWRYQKRRRAVLAGSLDGAKASSPRCGDERVCVRNACKTLAVALTARLNNIFRRIVERVVVNVVGQDGSSDASPRPRQPNDLSTAPVAGLSTWANFVEENGSSLADKAGCSREWMTRKILHSSRCRDAFRSGSISATRAAKPSEKTRWTTVGLAAVGACVFHL